VAWVRAASAQMLVDRAAISRVTSLNTWRRSGRPSAGRTLHSAEPRCTAQAGCTSHGVGCWRRYGMRLISCHECIKG
jgi:hypothetical protein